MHAYGRVADGTALPYCHTAIWRLAVWTCLVERPEIIPDLPKGGVDIQDVQLFWNFPSGRCSSYSMLQLRSLPEDEFLAYDSDAAYLEMGKQFR